MNNPLIRWMLLPTLFLFFLASCKKDNVEFDPRPTVDAGQSQTIMLPADSVKLSGSAKDSGGRIVAWLWSEVAGPNTPVIATDGASSTWVRGLVSGTYIFQLLVVDSLGDTGTDTVSVKVVANNLEVAGTFTLNTGNGPNFYEMHYMGNDQTNYSDNTAPELDAATWTVDGVVFTVRGAFRFDMSSLPANTPVRSALLSLYANHQPSNGDLVHANSGPANAFYIQRLAAAWDPATATWQNQPAADTTNRVLIPQTSDPFLDVTNVDVTAMVNKMISSGNYGFILHLQDEVIYNSRIFYSSRASDPTKHPSLVVTY